MICLFTSQVKSHKCPNFHTAPAEEKYTRLLEDYAKGVMNISFNRGRTSLSELREFAARHGFAFETTEAERSSKSKTDNIILQEH